MGYREFCLAAAALLPATLGQAQTADQVPRGYGVQQFTPKDFRMPEGSGCSGSIARWQAVQANDYASGNVNLKVYNQIQAEIARASAACAAGHDAEAEKLVASSRARHGYPQ